jgi:hypothetical protein
LPNDERLVAAEGHPRDAGAAFRVVLRLDDHSAPRS